MDWYLIFLDFYFCVYSTQYSVFRHMTLEQASVRRDSNQFAYNGGALKVACGQPYFYNTKVFFGRNGNSVHVWQYRLRVGYCLPNNGVC